MKGLGKEALVVWAFLIAGFLALEHFTGFSSDVGALASGAGTLTKDLQGR
jgi:hypothetical protein